LIIDGQIVLKKNLDLEIEEWKTPKKKITLLHFIQRKEENSKETSEKHSKMKRLHQTEVIIKDQMFHKFSASDVTNMDIMQEIVQPGRREDNMLPIMKIRERISTSYNLKT
jgi:hypothetical protein